ncbi:hypothetical protein OG887_43960 (plasmid) [Streptomyces sp. NBC_00053]|uniref:hypothetical protein n=1 Tax=unclassified Streptomyces TaxID=2593676 RepID=UPI000F5BF5B8|nr:MULTISPECIES: hypothetical protein [unclassified Streptomyces]MCX4400040.1 hypothetical protein [Streptomyces sp. NBC_01767]MCX5505961.1 hypothetical protein [Streptomyces sp. NBC_00052]MCX5554040.1 hypothetical protein [Streptomyces sp. NBC_00051]MCX5554386.1 hypothetical protein [Streptomyces sp. NBC_00051]RPK56037.1 hypothetical protein EES42_41295 [Streptomyces sp. ADI95-17]
MNLEILIACGVPALAALAGLVLRPRHKGSNLWDVLHELARGRVGAGMERERRATLVVMLDRLPQTGVRVEDTAQGRRTVISGLVESRSDS